MTPATLLPLLVPSIALAMGALFLCFWHYHRHLRYLRTLSAAAMALTAGALIHHAGLQQGWPTPAFALINGIYLVALVFCLRAFLERRQRQAGPFLTWVLPGLLLLISLYFATVDDNQRLRILLLHGGAGGLALLTWWKLRGPQRHRVDTILRLLLLLFALQFLLRLALGPIVSQETGSAFGQSTFWFLFNFTLVLSMIGIGLGFGASITQDLLAALHHDRLTDPLTGLHNRRALDSVALRLLHPHRRVQPHLLLLDLDHFKQINDQYGHQAGDLALQAVAKTLQEHLRGQGHTARIGGEEFAVLLADVTTDTAQILAERLRRSIATLSFAPPLDTIQLTTSIGLALARPTDNFETLFARADRRLYRAKRQGRNRVITQDPATPSPPAASAEAGP